MSLITSLLKITVGITFLLYVYNSILYILSLYFKYKKIKNKTNQSKNLKILKLYAKITVLNNKGINMKNKVVNKTLPIIYQKIKRELVYYSDYILGSSPIKALHYHDKLEIGVCVKGNGITRINDKAFNFKQGDIQCIPSGVAHLSTSAEGQKSRWIWLTFSPLEVFKTAGITDPESTIHLTEQAEILCGVFDKDKYPSLTKTINYLIDCVREVPQNVMSIAFAIGSFLTECSKINKEENNCIKDYNNPLVNGILDYISENIDDNQSLSESSLAKKLNVSIASVNRIFRAQTGYPPKTFIMRYRMAMAEWLLISSKLSIIDISLKVGYSDTSGFNRIFKRFFNVTPYQYRKLNNR